MVLSGLPCIPRNPDGKRVPSGFSKCIINVPIHQKKHISAAFPISDDGNSIPLGIQAKNLSTSFIPSLLQQSCDSGFKICFQYVLAPLLPPPHSKPPLPLIRVPA